MRTPLSPPHHPLPATPTHRARLWPALEPMRQQQLAQCLAELIRRLRTASLTTHTEGTRHESS